MKSFRVFSNYIKSLIFFACVVFNTGIGAQVLQGEIVPGSYRPMLVTPYGQLISADALVSAGFNDVTPFRRAIGLGTNGAVDIASVPEDVWSGSSVYPWMTAATSLEIVSSSANDSAIGTGARTVSLQCLDAAFVEQSETITLNGTTPVAFTKQCFRINNSFILSAGTGKVNAGNLTIRDSGGGTTRALIPVGYGTAQQSVYTVPAGYTLQVVSIFMAVTKNSGPLAYADFVTFMQFPAGGGHYRTPVTYSVSNQAPYRHDSSPGIVLTEKTDFCLRVISVSSNGLAVSGSWLGILRKNP